LCLLPGPTNVPSTPAESHSDGSSRNPAAPGQSFCSPYGRTSDLTISPAGRANFSPFRELRIALSIQARCATISARASPESISAVLVDIRLGVDLPHFSFPGGGHGLLCHFIRHFATSPFLLHIYESLALLQAVVRRANSQTCRVEGRRLLVSSPADEAISKPGFHGSGCASVQRLAGRAQPGFNSLRIVAGFSSCFDLKHRLCGGRCQLRWFAMRARQSGLPICGLPVRMHGHRAGRCDVRRCVSILCSPQIPTWPTGQGLRLV
jgi:hypothetical protein